MQSKPMTHGPGSRFSTSDYHNKINEYQDYNNNYRYRIKANRNSSHSFSISQNLYPMQKVSVSDQVEKLFKKKQKSRLEIAEAQRPSQSFYLTKHRQDSRDNGASALLALSDQFALDNECGQSRQEQTGLGQN